MLTGADFEPGATIIGLAVGTLMFVPFVPFRSALFVQVLAAVSIFLSMSTAMEAFELGAIRGLCRRWE